MAVILSHTWCGGSNFNSFLIFPFIPCWGWPTSLNCCSFKILIFLPLCVCVCMRVWGPGVVLLGLEPRACMLDRFLYYWAVFSAPKLKFLELETYFSGGVLGEHVQALSPITTTVRAHISYNLINPHHPKPTNPQIIHFARGRIRLFSANPF